MNYENIRLDKSMYKSEKGFSNALETIDQSKLYYGTELAGLDAYQRQLKRFDIKVSGSNSDCMAKFFQTSDSTVLFPEYICRTVTSGMNEANIIDKIIASKSNINSLDYRSVSTSQIDSDVPETTIKLNDNLVVMKKRGRLLSASYEAIKFQRIDLITVALKQIGAYISKAVLKDATNILLENCETISIDNKLTYADIVSLWGKFDNFEMNTLLVSPDMALELLAIEELKNTVYCNNGIAISPMGASLIKTSAIPNSTIIALDNRFALEMIEAGGLSVEYDKLINAQFERAAITKIAGFSKIFPDAVKVLKNGGKG